MIYSTYNKGYSLIEVLVAVALLMFAIVGPMTIAVKSMQSAQYARQQNTAFFLAQEGISALNAIRNDAGLARSTGVSTDAWSWIDAPAFAPCKASYGCDIDFRDQTLTSNITSCETPDDCMLLFSESAGRARYQHIEGEVSPYHRFITLTEVGADEVIVVSEVVWQSGLLNGVQRVKLTTSLFNIFK